MLRWAACGDILHGPAVPGEPGDGRYPASAARLACAPFARPRAHEAPIGIGSFRLTFRESCENPPDWVLLPWPPVRFLEIPRPEDGAAAAPAEACERLHRIGADRRVCVLPPRWGTVRGVAARAWKPDARASAPWR